MIEFHYLAEFELNEPTRYSDWISRVLTVEAWQLGNINYIFCDDNYLHDLNVRYLNHDTLTDIITFDYTAGREISGDIFISVERIEDNASLLKTPFYEELKRVMIHGILHLQGHSDKSDEEKAQMRGLEEEKMKLFHVEH